MGRHLLPSHRRKYRATKPRNRESTDRRTRGEMEARLMSIFGLDDVWFPTSYNRERRKAGWEERNRVEFKSYFYIFRDSIVTGCSSLQGTETIFFFLFLITATSFCFSLPCEQKDVFVVVFVYLFDIPSLSSHKILYTFYSHALSRSEFTRLTLRTSLSLLHLLRRIHIVEGSRHSVNTNTASFGLVLWTEYVSLWWSPWLVGGEAGRHPAVHVSLLFHVERYWFSAFVSLVSCLPREKGLTVCVVGGTDYRPHVIINTQTWLNCRRLLTSGEFSKRFTFIVVSCVFGWSSLL